LINFENHTHTYTRQAKKKMLILDGVTIKVIIVHINAMMS